MLIRNAHWPRRTVLIFALASLFSVVVLATFYHQYRTLNSVSSFLRQSASPALLPPEPEIPSIPAECSALRSNPPQDKSDGLAVALSPAELLCRTVDPNAPGIPKLFHQSWKNSELPAKFQRWSKGCREKHADWEWVLWTDEDNLKLVQTYFPWLEKTFLGLPGPIYRADFVRNLYMYMFGGVYADLDTECLRSTGDALAPFRIPFVGMSNGTTSEDPANHRGVAVFGRLGSDEAFEHSIPNAWMAASPRHPFFLLSVQLVETHMHGKEAFLRHLGVTQNAEHITGPIALRQSVLRWKATLMDLWDEVVLLPSHMIYPYSWANPGPEGRICSAMFASLDEALCKERLKVKDRGSLTITYWSNTHKGTGHNEETIAQVSQD